MHHENGTTVRSMDDRVSFWRSFAVALLCWTAIGIFTGWGMFSADRAQANFLPYAHYVVWSAANCYSWAIITPFLFAFVRHYPLDKDHWLLRLPLYVAFTGTVSFARFWINGLGWLYRPDRHASFTATSLSFMRKGFYGDIPIFIMLYILVAYQNARREARRRRLHEAELQSRVSNAELQMLRMQLQPHFLFNSLQAATVLIHDNPSAAETVLQRLSELLRVALDDTRSFEVPLKDEIAFLENYVEIQKQRFQDRLSVRYDIPTDTSSVPVPSLLLQPLVENAIHHGIGLNKGSDIVEITARLCGADLSLRVSNLASSLTPNEHTNGHGVGLKNTQARLQQMYGDRASIKLEPLHPRGVCATVLLPVERLA